MKRILSALLFVLVLAQPLSAQLNRWGSSFCPHVEIAKKLEVVDNTKFNHKVLSEITEEFDFALSKALTPNSPNFEALEKVWASLGMFSKEASSDLTAEGMKGYTRFAGGIIRANGSDFVEALARVFGGSQNFDGSGFNKVMSYLDQNGTWLTQTRWKSKAGVLFFDKGSREGHRLSHVLSHTQPGFKPNPHSIFKGSREEMFDVLDEGWLKPSSSRLQGLDKNGIPDSGAWVVDMGRQVGTATGETKIRYIIKSGTAGDLITAYPVTGLRP